MKITETDLNTDKVIMPFGKPDAEYEVEKITEIPSKRGYAFVKRLFDIIISVIGIILLMIPMLIVYFCVSVTSTGSPIYKQERLGLNGKKFYLYKYRTMYENAEENGAQWAQGYDDERITPLGKILRRTRFDEVPQLFNCLVGDLSLVGPRPEREVFYDCFETYIHGFSQRLMVKPGITGLAQVNGGYLLKPEEKIVYDIEYIKNRSLWNDIKILFATVSVVIHGDGSNIPGGVKNITNEVVQYEKGPFCSDGRENSH